MQRLLPISHVESESYIPLPAGQELPLSINLTLQPHFLRPINTLLDINHGSH
jgi:hypothetical protein